MIVDEKIVFRSFTGLLFVIHLVSCSNCSSQAPDDSTGDTSSNTGSDADTDSDNDTDADTDTDSLSMEMVPIPAGSFWMGSPDGDCPPDYPGGAECEAEPWGLSDEKLHYVTLTRPFEIQKMETTRKDFVTILHWDSTSGLDTVEKKFYNHPVRWASFFDALVYANELSRRQKLEPCFVLTDMVCSEGMVMGPDEDETACYSVKRGGIMEASVYLNEISNVYDCKGYRLPTEAEWEYAIRAGSLTAFYPSEGNDGSITQMENDPNLIQIGWEHGNSGGETHPVGEKEPNAWGLYDMSGNAMELLFDEYVEYPDCDTQEPCIDPVTFTENAPKDIQRISRGGDFGLGAAFARSAKRSTFATGGFRLARTLEK